jgi:hypothetical protein
MPAVITYWQVREDEDDFLAYLATTGNVVAMPDRWVRAKEELAPRPIVQYVRQDYANNFVFGLAHYALAAVIEPKLRDGEEHFALAYMSPCVIMYSRGQIRDGNKLGQSNIAAYWTYPDKEARTLLAKDASFVKWAKKVFAWVRRHTPVQIECNRYSYRATERAKQAVEMGLIEAVLY